MEVYTRALQVLSLSLSLLNEKKREREKRERCTNRFIVAGATPRVKGCDKNVIMRQIFGNEYICLFRDLRDTTFCTYFFFFFAFYVNEFNVHRQALHLGHFQFISINNSIFVELSDLLRD